MKNPNTEKQLVMSVALPELKQTLDGNGVIVSPDVLITVAQKAKALARYAHSRVHGSSVCAEIQFDPIEAVTIKIFATPLEAYLARYPNAFGASVANFPNAFTQDHAALDTLFTTGTQGETDAIQSKKAIVARANLRKVLEDKDGVEMIIKTGEELPISVQTVKPTSTTFLSQEVEEITGCVRNVDSQDNRVRLFKLGPQKPNLMLFVKTKEDRERLLQAQLESTEVTVKFRRQTNSMTSSHAPRHGVLVEIKEPMS